MKNMSEHELLVIEGNTKTLKGSIQIYARDTAISMVHNICEHFDITKSELDIKR